MRTTSLKLIALTLAIVALGAGCGSKSAAPQNDGGVWRSTTGADSWEQKVKLPTTQGSASLARVDVITLLIDPTDRKTLYAGTLQNGLFISYDQGDTWRQPPRLIKDGLVRSIIVDPRNRCTMYATWNNKIMQSKDCAISWTELYAVPQAGVDVRALVIDPTDPNRILAGLSNGQLMVTTDTGATWRGIYKFPSRVVRVVMNPDSVSIMYVATATSGLFRTTDGGATWEDLRKKMNAAVSGGKKNLAVGYDVVLDPKNGSLVYFATKLGILKSVDDGETWDIVPILSSPGEARIYSMVVSPHSSNEIYYSATVGTRAVLYKTTDAGETWTIKKMPTTRVALSLKVDPEVKTLLYAGSYFVPPEK